MFFDIQLCVSLRWILPTHKRRNSEYQFEGSCYTVRKLFVKHQNSFKRLMPVQSSGYCSWNTILQQIMMDNKTMDRIRVLELYSGIGGMHFALKKSVPNAEVVAAVDINPVANEVYRHNFPTTKVIGKGIEGFSVKMLDDMKIDMVLMSPPCQPFTRVGLQKDVDDPRTKSFLHFLSILPKLKKFPARILLENVKGFEDSQAHSLLCKLLKECGYQFIQFLLSPKQLGIPNARMRYYLIAKTGHFQGGLLNEGDKIWETLPSLISENGSFDKFENSADEETSASMAKRPKLDEENDINERDSHCACKMKAVEGFLTEEPIAENLVAEKVKTRYIGVFDIVRPDSTNTTCFTKAYTQYAEGTGSVLRLDALRTDSEPKDSADRDPQNYRLRYFSPREVANFLCFPESFTFPDEVTRKQRYRLLGNSLNVKVVSVLLDLLLMISAGSGDDIDI